MVGRLTPRRSICTLRRRKVRNSRSAADGVDEKSSVINRNAEGGVRCLFVTALLLPPFRRSPNAGNARKLLQMSCGQLAIISEHEGFSFIYFKVTWLGESGCT